MSTSSLCIITMIEVCVRLGFEVGKESKAKLVLHLSLLVVDRFRCEEKDRQVQIE